MSKSWGQGKILAVLSNRDYLLLWLGQLVSSIGTAFNYVSLIFLLLRTSDFGSVSPLFGLVLINALVILIFAPFTGVLIDTWDRRRTMIFTDLARAGLVLMIPWASELWQIYLVSVFISLCTLLFEPARNSVLPRVLQSRKELLFMGNSFMTTSSSLAETVGFLTGGVFVTVFGFATAFYLDSSTFLISAACIWFLRLAPSQEEPEEIGVRETVEGFLTKTRGGLKAVWSLGQLRSVFSYYFLFAAAFGSGNFLFPILIEEGYQLGPGAFGFFSGSMTLGYLVGSFVIGPLGEKISRFRLLTGAVFIIGFSTLGLGVARSFLPILPWSFLIGFMNPVTLVFSRSFIQEEVAEENLGRIFSLFSLIMQVGVLVSLALSFGLLQLLSITQVMVILGLVTIFVAMVGPVITRLSRFISPVGNAEGTEMPFSG